MDVDSEEFRRLASTNEFVAAPHIYALDASNGQYDQIAPFGASHGSMPTSMAFFSSLTSLPSVTDLRGCADESATNYDPNSKLPGFEADNSCRYETFGCGDPEAYNYISYATITDLAECKKYDKEALCTCTYLIFGCVANLCGNFDSLATMSVEPVPNTEENLKLLIESDYYGATNFLCEDCGNPGCMDSAALNYNSLATSEMTPEAGEFFKPELQCVPVIYGCTDKKARNYMKNATTPPCPKAEDACGDCPLEDSYVHQPTGIVKPCFRGCDFEVKGCMDSNALNYMATANTASEGTHPRLGGDDFSACLPRIRGCTAVLS
jgi:hypothetical protein